MTTFRLILKEILQRKLNFFLSLLAIVIAASLFVSFFTTGEASKNETIRLMRDIGFNLRRNILCSPYGYSSKESDLARQGDLSDWDCAGVISSG